MYAIVHRARALPGSCWNNPLKVVSWTAAQSHGLLVHP